MYVIVFLKLLISYRLITSQSDKPFYLQTNAIKFNSVKKEELILLKRFIPTLDNKLKFIFKLKLIQLCRVNSKRWKFWLNNKKDPKFNSVDKLKKLKRKLLICYKTSLKLILLKKYKIYFQKWMTMEIGKTENKVHKQSWLW